MNESRHIKTLVALDDSISREAVDSAIPTGSLIDIVGVVDGLDAAWSTLQATPNDLLVVACSGYSDRVLYLIDTATKHRPERPIVVLCEGYANGFVQRVFEAGADDFVSLPESSDNVLFALQKALARKRGAAVASGIASAPMIVIVGPKGGTGKTLTAVNLAAALAAKQKRVAVVDLDLQFGDVGLSYGLPPEKTIYDLAKSGGSLDTEKIDAYLMKHRTGVSVLTAPTRPDQASVVSIEFLREVYATLRSSNDFLIIDTPPGFTPEVIATIDASSHVCMVAMLDALSLKNTKVGLETLELMGYASDRIRVVLNRADSRVGITDTEVWDILGRVPDISVPSSRNVPRAVNEGSPITVADPKSAAARAFRSLAEQYIGDSRAEFGENGGPKRRRLSLRRSRS